MNPRKNLKGGIGGGFLGIGMAFVVLALTGQTAFLGVAMAFVAVGIALFAKSRQGC
ncbi:MAG: hypothetical protein V4704_02290 [Pseudomonadota bacterium]